MLPKVHSKLQQYSSVYLLIFYKTWNMPEINSEMTCVATSNNKNKHIRLEGFKRTPCFNRNSCFALWSLLALVSSVIPQTARPSQYCTGHHFKPFFSLLFFSFLIWDRISDSSGWCQTCNWGRPGTSDPPASISWVLRSEASLTIRPCLCSFGDWTQVKYATNYWTTSLDIKPSLQAARCWNVAYRKHVILQHRMKQFYQWL